MYISRNFGTGVHYFAGKLVYLIVLASVQLAVTNFIHLVYMLLPPIIRTIVNHNICSQQETI